MLVGFAANEVEKDFYDGTVEAMIAFIANKKRPSTGSSSAYIQAVNCWSSCSYDAAMRRSRRPGGVETATWGSTRAPIPPCASTGLVKVCSLISLAFIRRVNNWRYVISQSKNTQNGPDYFR